MDDREILRELARAVGAIAADPEMAVRRRRWRDHNRLAGERPLVLTSPEGAWSELVPDSDLRCSDPQLRSWERTLRQQVYWWTHIRDDAYVDPWFNVRWRVDLGHYGVDIPYAHGENRGSYAWQPPLVDLPADLDRLRPRRPTVDRAGTQADLERARDLIGDLLPVRVHGSLWWTVGLTWPAALLVGLEPLMLLMYDQPETVHRLMAFLRDDHLAVIRWCEREGLLSANNDASGVGSGGLGCTDELQPPPPGSGAVRLRDCWGFAESQETVGISPEMFAEFVLPYQLPLLEQFGLTCYGCCEPLEHRIHLVTAQVPRLRRVSVAPAADQERMAAALGDRFIYSRKVQPAHVCVDFNEPAVRADLRRTLAAAGGQPLELILKDTHTVQGDAARIGRWVRIAYEELDRHFGGRGAGCHRGGVRSTER